MHTNPTTQRVDAGSGNKSTLAQRRRDQPGELKHVHKKPRDTEGGPREVRVTCTQPCDTEGERWGLREAHTSRRDTEGSTQAPT